MGKSSPSAAPPRQLDVELQQILSQWPALLAGERTNTPGAVTNDLSNLRLALEGSAGGRHTVYENILTDGWRNRQTGEISSTMPGPSLDNKNGGGVWDPYQMHQTREREVDTPATTGLYDLLQSGSERLGGIQRTADTAARRAAHDDLRNLNPEQARLYDLLAADAEAGMKAGDRLTREETFNTVNPIRNDWAARGLGSSAPGQLDEAVNLVTAGRGVAQQRRSNAGAVASLGNQMYSAPAMAYASDDVSGAHSFMGYSGAYGQQPSILEQIGGYSQDIFAGNWNAENANNINRANARNATTTGAVVAGTTIAAAAL